jgi:hypothetical protein
MSTMANHHGLKCRSRSRKACVKIKVSVRLSCSENSKTLALPSSDYVNMYITSCLKDYSYPLGMRSNEIMCSLLVQIGKLLHVKIPRKDYVFSSTSKQWCLLSLKGRDEKVIGRLNDIVDGDRLILNCDKLWTFAHSEKDILRTLPFKKIVNATLTSPTSSKAVGRSIFRPDVSGKENNSEVIVIDSDDESDCSSDVEDVTDVWRAKQDEERRRMKVAAEEID